MRWTDSAMFSQEPPSGVYKGITPWAHSQSTRSGLLWPVRLSQMSNARRGGRSAGQGEALAQACLPGLPASPRGLRARPRPLPGRAARIATSSALSQGWSTALGPSPRARRAPRPWRAETASAAWPCPRGCTRAAAGGLPHGLPGRTGLWDGLVGASFILAPDRHPALLPERVRPLDQLFGGGVGVGDRDRSRLPPAYDRPCLAPRATLLPGIPSIPEGIQNGLGAHPGQPVQAPRGAPAAPWSATRWRCRPLLVRGRRNSCRMRSRVAASYTAGGPPPWRGSSAVSPSVLKRATSWATASPDRRPWPAPPR